MKRSNRSAGGGRRPARKKAAGKARPDAEERGSGFAGGAFGASIDRFFDLQRKVLRAGTAAARSAVDNPAESLQGGLRKLEQVFDERVAAALARMGMPSPEKLREVCATVEALSAAPAGKTRKPRKNG